MIQKYFKTIEEQLFLKIDKIKKLKKETFEPTDSIDSFFVEDMPEKVEKQLINFSVTGLATKIRKNMDLPRDKLAFLIAKESLQDDVFDSEEKILERAVRIGLAILTEGTTVCMLDGVSFVKILEFANKKYVSIGFEGPIRAAGATAQALTIILTDYLRQILGVPEYQYDASEIARVLEEVELYEFKHARLQYRPTADEIRVVCSGLKIQISGKGLSQLSVFLSTDHPRIPHNFVRGGACLTLCEGFCSKTRKIKKFISENKINGWDFLDECIELKEKTNSIKENVENDSSIEEKMPKYMQEVMSGRPVFSEKNMPGSFRLKLGRTRLTGLCAVGINPFVTYVCMNFLGYGTQVRTEFPGKSALITFCSTIDGPTVQLSNQEQIQINTYSDLHYCFDKKIIKILDLGEILISLGDFIENNVVPPEQGYTEQKFLLEGGTKEMDFSSEILPLYLKKKFSGLPPKYNFAEEDLFEFISSLVEIKKKILTLCILKGNTILFPKNKLSGDISLFFEKIQLVFYSFDDSFISLSPSFYGLLYILGIERKNGSLASFRSFNVDEENVAGFLNLGTFLFKKKNYVGLKMGRPEKAAMRKNIKNSSPANMLLFSKSSNILKNMVSLEEEEFESISFICDVCMNNKKEFYSNFPKCYSCGSKTRLSTDINENKLIKKYYFVNSIFQSFSEKNNLPLPKTIKSSEKILNKTHIQEIFEKGFLRARNGLFVFKDGTCRHDSTDAPMTHFVPKEINLSLLKLKQLGYTTDIFGKTINSEDQIIELFPQDVIVPESAIDFFFRVGKFIDEYLSFVCKQEKICNYAGYSDIFGELVVGIAPHTSAGIIGRVIGYTKYSVNFCHPTYHCAKRRNCDGDEDSFILLVDLLLNYSKHYLPTTMGGRMDVPLVVVKKINYFEIDKEVLNLDVSFSNTLDELSKLSECSIAKKYLPSFKPNILKNKISKDVSSYMGVGFTDNTNLEYGNPISCYKEEGGMELKLKKQLQLTNLLSSVSSNRVAALILEKHFIPDILGNFNKFFSQTFRCTKCKEKYPSVPLSGKCICGTKLVMTIHKNGLIKYLPLANYIVENYNVGGYLKDVFFVLLQSISVCFGKQNLSFFKKELAEYTLNESNCIF